MMKAKVFKPGKPVIYEAYVPELRQTVRFSPLSVKELVEIASIGKPLDIAIKITARALQKANPKITEQSVEEMPVATLFPIMKVIFTFPGFLPEEHRLEMLRILQQPGDGQEGGG
jgi:hypothetical protein